MKGGPLETLLSADARDLSTCHGAPSRIRWRIFVEHGASDNGLNHQRQTCQHLWNMIYWNMLYVLLVTTCNNCFIVKKYVVCRWFSTGTLRFSRYSNPMHASHTSRCQVSFNGDFFDYPFVQNRAKVNDWNGVWIFKTDIAVTISPMT